MADTAKKKKGGAATPSLKDCANCGAPEGSIPGTPCHKPCSRCELAFYCSVMCQKHHWKEGGHKKHCVKKEDRSVSKVVESKHCVSKADRRVADAKEAQGAESGADGTVRECAICLEKLTKGGSVVKLPCEHSYHAQCVENLRAFGVKQVCPLCRADLPPSAQKLFEDGCVIITRVMNKVRHKNNY
jgi:hypothetical protein